MQPQSQNKDAANSAPADLAAEKLHIPVAQKTKVSYPVSAGGRASEPAAVVLASDLLRWIIPKVGKFPRTVSADQLRTRVAAWMGHAMHASNPAVVDTVLARAGVGRVAGNASNFFSGVSQIA